MVYILGNMIFNLKNEVAYLTFPELQKLKFVKHAFSTKLGGVSKNEFTSMNLGFNRGDTRENVLENYCRLCRALNINIDDLVASSQDHGTFIRCVDEKNKGLGIFRKHDIDSVDGLLTNVPGVALVTYYADCVPIYFVDPKRKVVGLAHAGWRGTVGCIGRKMIYKMQEEYASSADDIICAIGPSIGRCCFEVDEDVMQKFSLIKDINIDNASKKLSDGKYSIDLQNVNRQILISAGVNENNIHVANICTCCNSDILFSHRQTGGRRGTMVAVIEIEERILNNEQ